MADGDSLILGKANLATNSTGVSVSGTNTWGVYIKSLAGIALNGSSEDSIGLQGISNAGLSGNVVEDHTAAVRGWANFNAIGVVGVSRGNIGVDGKGSIGVRGQSVGWLGVQGVSFFDAGVYGHSFTQSGVVGSTDNPSNFAGFFWGGVGVTGHLTVWGGKSAAVPFPDGSHRLLYAMESPENWFEDFGTARLVRGRTRVKLDRDFAKVVRLADYHVFISPAGDSRGLYVSKKTKEGFEVREQQGGTGNVRFSYRIVARRKDFTAKRFARAVLPKRPKTPNRPAAPPQLKRQRRKSTAPAANRRRSS